ncbi:hypothetical protein OWV82_017063 [Melia azedarach]|uniref:Uncharacterized protein n=1 Tax=Melia azedarach TaxID=155640 RepID=A0ACC1XI70_MELAZ|nr:hypothetical protein OWV82_017063 [Melia azedarach]
MKLSLSISGPPTLNQAQQGISNGIFVIVDKSFVPKLSAPIKPQPSSDVAEGKTLVAACLRPVCYFNHVLCTSKLAQRRCVPRVDFQIQRGASTEA